MAKKSSAKGKVILYTSKLLKDGTHPIMLRITYKQKRHYYSTGYYGTKAEWQVLMSDDCPGKLESKKFEIIGIQAEAIRTIRLIELEQGFFNINEFENRMFNSREGIELVKILEEVLNDLQRNGELAPRTIRSYGNAISALKRYQDQNSKKKSNNILYLQSVNTELLKDFEKFIKKTAGDSTLGIYMRGFKAMYNRALNKCCYNPPVNPFNGYKIKAGDGNPTGLSKEDILKIYTYPTEPFSPEWYAQTYFIFCYLNQGMNLTDLALLKWDNIVDDRLIYTRSKTKKHKNPDKFSIKIKKEIRTILDYFATEGSHNSYIFPILTEGLSPKREIDVVDQKAKMINKYLRRIAKSVGIQQDITTYVSRHSYATTLLNNDIPLHIIQEQLGHGEARTTRKYAKRLKRDTLDKVNEDLL